MFVVGLLFTPIGRLALGLHATLDQLAHRSHAQFLRGQRGAGLDIVRCYQGFSDRLETAITQQSHAVTQAQAAEAQAGATLTA